MTQAERLEACLALFVPACLSRLDAQGGYVGGDSPPDDRDRMRWAVALLMHGGEQGCELAGKLILQVFSGGGTDYTLLPLEGNLTDARRAITRDWNMFHSNDAAYVLAVHRARLSAAVQAKLERIVRRNSSRYAGSAQPDYLPHGYNDNMPAHAASGLILGGQALGDEQAVADGVYRLELFAEILSRRGKVSEYSSGTYLPLTLCSIAKIAEYAEDPEVRALALAIEAQVWADVMLHYHVGTGRNAAAQSRAYTWNSVGHVDTLACIRWIAYGVPEAYNPFAYALEPVAGQVYHHEGRAWKSLGGIVSALAPYHPPAYLAEALAARTYPYQVTASSENGGSYGGDVGSTSWHMPAYALASSTTGYHTGKQSEVFYAVYRRSRQVQDFRQTGSVYTRFLVNDDEPGKPGTYGCEADLCPNSGVMRAVQREGRVMLLSRGSTGKTSLPCHRIRQAVILPAHFFAVQACWLGEQPVTDFQAESEAAVPVFLDLGQAYLALYPLTMTNHGRKALIRLERINAYQIISFVNYEGPTKTFDATAFQETFNGFVAQISGPDESGSFTAFRKSWYPGIREDWWFFGNRRSRWIVDGHELAMNWATERDVLRSITVDGRDIERTPLRATGFDTQHLPLLNQPYRPLARPLPYKTLSMAWNPAAHWQISISG